MMVEELEHVRESISEVEEKIEEICLDFPEYKHLLTISGFGKDISSKVLGAIGNPFRFDNAKQVVKLSGWDLNANRSGKSSAGATAVISKKAKPTCAMRCTRRPWLLHPETNTLLHILRKNSGEDPANGASRQK